MQIGEYRLTSPFITAGSGNARWCIAIKDDKQYFLKQFLAPVQPVQTTDEPTEIIQKRRLRCAAFERRKLALYEALKGIKENCIVRVDDFFVHDGHYFAASEYITPSHRTFDSIRKVQPQLALRLLVSLAECLWKLHDHGVVHADLKPEHIIIEEEWGMPYIRLIDFDSGFLETVPPESQSNIEVDPVYLSPEAYRLITGEPVTLNRYLDTFAFGLLIHQALTGELPQFDKAKYSYLYACVLDGGRITFSDKLSRRLRSLVHGMLKKDPASRPGDAEICRVLKISL
jgi:eukaryotic-like serine/threonine-protein kinase